MHDGERRLAGTVAVVTGASRGAGRGAALELGAAGATVYVTGRTTRAAPARRDNSRYAGMLDALKADAMPGTIDDTADAVTSLGGRGIAVPCDHERDDEVAALFERVEREHGRLDVLVNNAWGGHEAFDHANFTRPLWEQPLEQWDAMFTRGVRHHLVAIRRAAPLLVRQRRGLIVGTTYWGGGAYIGNLFYDLAKAALVRLAFDAAEELRPHGVASVALSPGWMRTELVLGAYDASEERWHDVPALARTESPRYLGRAVVALASDPNVMARSGRVLQVGDLAREYGFTDVDGRQPEPFAVG